MGQRDQKIFQAIQSGDAEALGRHLECGGNPDIVFVVDSIMKTRWSALHQCCQKGKYDCVKTLIDKGNDLMTIKQDSYFNQCQPVPIKIQAL